MPDSVRVVQFQPGGQITELAALQGNLDFTVLNQGFTRDSLAILKGDRNQQMISRGGRYDGEYFGGEKLSNSTYKFQILQAGVTPDALLSKMATLFAITEKVPGPHYIEHKNDGASFPSYYEIRAPAKVQDLRSWVQQKGAGSIALDVEWPVAPLACGAPMDINDQAVATNLADYTFDALAAATFPTAAGSLASERRIIHSIRGYTHATCHVTVRGAPGPTISGYKLGAIPKRVAANSYVECYVDDNGVNSRLRIDTINAGVRTNRFTTNLGTRISSGTAISVYGHIEGSTVYADGAGGSGSYTLLAGDLALLGIGTQGFGGFSWTPQDAAATTPTIKIRPHSYRNKTLPGNWTLDGLIPGTAPAKVDAFFSLVPYWPFGLLGWAGGSPSFFGLYDFSGTADANGLGGSVNQTAAFAGSFAVTQSGQDFSLLPADDDTPGRVAVEVWAQLKIGSTMAGLKVRAGWRDFAGVDTPWVYTLESGAVGKSIPAPSAGTVLRMVRLGTMVVSTVQNSASPAGQLVIEAIAGTGGATFGVDFAILVPASRRASSPSGKANNAAYPVFGPSTATQSRLIRSDLSGAWTANFGLETTDYGQPYSGFGGAPIEFPPGSVSVAGFYASLIPDDPTVSATSAPNTAGNRQIHFSIVPRYLHQRDQ